METNAEARPPSEGEIEGASTSSFANHRSASEAVAPHRDVPPKRVAPHPGGDPLWERFTGKRDGTLWYYGELLEVYKRKAPRRCADLVEAFERTYRELSALAARA